MTHIDDDVVLPAAPSADSAVSLSKLELIPAARRSVMKAYREPEVDERDAEELARVLVELGAVDLAEIYSPARSGRKCAAYGLRPGFAIDLTTTKPDGMHWDLDRPEDKELLKELQRTEEPYIVIGSPPCTEFSSLMRLNYGPEELARRQEEFGMPHLRTAVETYKRQLACGKHFLHEHPATASSWQTPEIRSLVEDERCYLVQGPMCK